MKKSPFFTVMIIPHTERVPKALKLSVHLVRFLSVATIISLTSGFIWSYHYINVREQNQSLKLIKVQNEKVILDYSKDYLALYQDIKTLKEKMVSMEDLEEQVREKNGFDPTKSYFSKQNQVALAGNQDKNKMVASTLTISETKETVDQLKESMPTGEKSLNELVRLMENRNEVLLSIPSIWPTVGRVTSRFGYRRDPFNGNVSFHDGIDIANSYGTPIYATADGIVTFAGWNSGGYGNEVIINHGNGLETVYGHNSRIAIKVGDYVHKGQVIAYMGSTGRSTGPHSHYEIRKYGEKVNPFNYLN